MIKTETEIEIETEVKVELTHNYESFKSFGQTVRIDYELQNPAIRNLMSPSGDIRLQENLGCALADLTSLRECVKHSLCIKSASALKQKHSVHSKNECTEAYIKSFEGWILGSKPKKVTPTPTDLFASMQANFTPEQIAEMLSLMQSNPKS